MRKLTLTQFMTFDGVVQSPGGPTRTRAAASPRAPSLEHLGPEHIELERTRILEGEDDVTHMHYRVQR
jgi:hypothetical protein